MSNAPDGIRQRMRILGVPVDIVTLPGMVEALRGPAGESGARTVFVRDVASLMAARSEPCLLALHETSDWVVPDGMPLVWIGRLRGLGRRIGRVSGGDLVDAICAASVETGQSHYFYGGRPGVAEAMAARLAARYPGLKIAGTDCPPMRDIGPDFTPGAQDHEELERIRQARPDFIWVGISSPKQEYWMAKAAPLVGQGVFLGVGAAFDFHAGTVRRAPLWMQRSGLEWLHRLLSEPRRLWRRYLVLAPTFVGLVLLEGWTGRASRRQGGGQL